MKRVVRGQPVSRIKHDQSKQLRRNMTPAGKTLWQALRRNQLDGFHFRRQQIIAGFIVDFYCHAVRLVVEVDGAIHAKSIERDAERERILTQHGFHILRVTNDDVLHELPQTLQKISAAIHRLQQKAQTNRQTRQQVPSP